MDAKQESEKKPGTPKTETSVAADAQPKPKKSLTWRIVKGLLWFIGGLLFFTVVALLALPLWIGPVATSLANAIVPKYTDTAFKVEQIDLDPYTGKLLVTGVELANHDGYSEKDAFALESISVELEVSSLFSKTIHVVDVTIDSPFASYIFDAKGTNNFDRIMAAVDRNLGPKEKHEAAKEEESPSEATTKVVVDKVTVKNVRVAVANGKFELGTLTLSDFGKNSTTKIELADIRLLNPEGFSAENAFSLKALTIGMDTSALDKPPFKIHDIVIDSPYASYVFDKKKVDNFTRMLEPLLAKGNDGNKDTHAETVKETKEPTTASGSPVTLDKLEVRNIQAQICEGKFELASLVVTDYGKPTAAMVKLAGAKLANPKGFTDPVAFSLKSLSIGLETAYISKMPIVFHDIIVDSTYAGLVYNDAGDSNFDVMFKPLMGGDEEDGKKDDTAKVASAKGEKPKVEASNEKKDEKDEEGGGMCVKIDKLDIGGTKIQYRKISLPIPLPTFTDIGKNSEKGATPQEVVDQVLAKVQEAMGGIGGLAGMLGADATNLLGNATGLLGASATNLLGNATSIVEGSVSNVLGNASGIVGGGVSNVLGSASNLLGVTSSFMSGSATNTLNGANSAIGEAIGGTKNVIGNTVGGATSLLGKVIPAGDRKKNDNASNRANSDPKGPKNVLRNLGGGLFGN